MMDGEIAEGAAGVSGGELCYFPLIGRHQQALTIFCARGLVVGCIACDVAGRLVGQQVAGGLMAALGKGNVQLARHIQLGHVAAIADEVDAFAVRPRTRGVRSRNDGTTGDPLSRTEHV